jgi:hypothetical protein
MLAGIEKAERSKRGCCRHDNQESRCLKPADGLRSCPLELLNLTDDAIARRKSLNARDRGAQRIAAFGNQAFGKIPGDEGADDVTVEQGPGAEHEKQRNERPDRDRRAMIGWARMQTAA